MRRISHQKRSVSRATGLQKRGRPVRRVGLVLLAHLSIVVLLLTCGHLLVSLSSSSHFAYATGGRDPMTVTLNEPARLRSRHQLDNVEAYCMDQWRRSPEVGTVFEEWEPGPLTVDYVLYHSQTTPGWTYEYSNARAVIWAFMDSWWSAHPDDVDEILYMAGNYTYSRPLYDAALEFAASGGKGPERGCSRMYHLDDDSIQRLTVGRFGTIELTKESTDKDISDDSVDFSLAGAVYGIFRDADCTDEVEGARMVTDADGHATSVLLGAASPTTFYVKELSPSPGFFIDDTVWPVVVSEGTPSPITSYETPAIGMLRLVKSSAGPADLATSPLYSLAGATYGVYRDEDCTDLAGSMTTDEDGVAFVQGLAARTYWVKETEPSPGHELDQNVYQAEILGEDIVTITSTDTQTLSQVEIAKSSQGTVDLGASEVYSLAGAVYGIFRDEACENLVTTATTDKEGHALAGDLPAGSYWVKEMEPSPGHGLDPTTYPVSMDVGEMARVDSVDWQLYGSIGITKASEAPQITAGNGRYDLDGACYVIYRDKACLEPECELVLRASVDGREAYAQSGELEARTYWVKEAEAPRGYLLDPEVHVVEVAPSQTAQVQVGEASHVQDRPAYDGDGSLLVKVDEDGVLAGSPYAQGSTTLGGALFEVRYFEGYYDSVDRLPPSSTRAWTFRSDESGVVGFDAAHLECGDELYATASGEPALPLGTYAIREERAPVGYRLEGQPDGSDGYVAPTHLMQIVMDEERTGTRRVFLGWDDGETMSPTGSGDRVVTDRAKRTGIAIVKVDAQTGEAHAQAGSSLAGLEFAIINRSGGPVYLDGESFGPDEEITPLRLRTDSSGQASTPPEVLPMGTYDVVEVDGNGSYLLDADIQSVTISEEDVNSRVPILLHFADHVVRGGVMVGKVDRQNGHRAPQGSSSFQGIVIGVRLCEVDSHGIPQEPALVDGALIQPGQIATTITLDAEGLGQLPPDTLPYGTWQLSELSVPDDSGLIINRDWSKSFDIREDQAIIDLTSPSDCVPNQVRRTDLRALKVESETQKALAHIPFVIESLTTSEWHVVVTDDEGRIDTSPTSQGSATGTNAHDEAVLRADDGSFVLAKASGLSATSRVWFSGNRGTGLEVAPDDTLGALPFDTYRMTELPVSKADAAASGGSSNEGLVLASFTFSVDDDGTVLDLGTIEDRPLPSIGTRAYCMDGDVRLRSAPMAEDVTLVDTVGYRGLVAGGTYRVLGELHMVNEDGSDAGVVATSSREFVAEGDSGRMELSFNLDTIALAGHSVVAFERLFSNGTVIATHEDLSNEDQTIGVPSIRTSLVDDSLSHEVASCGPIRLTDTVTYSGLRPGTSYEVVGTLMDKVTGQPIMNRDVPLSARTTFVPDTTAGTVEVVFEVDGALLAGRTVVAFERLSQGGHDLAVHTDLDDVEQTVTSPAIRTTLANIVDGSHMVEAGMVTLVDTVTYDGLIPGAEYQIKGTLMVKETHMPLTDPETGEALAATMTVVPDQPFGSVDVEFTFDTNAIEGHEVVAFEELWRDDRRLAAHTDLTDGDQTVRIVRPTMTTTLTDDTSHSHKAPCTGRVVLVDHVTYTDFIPGGEYLITITLLDEETGRPIEEGDSTVSTSVTVTPHESEGSVDIPLEVDATPLQGKTVVARESLAREGQEVVVHADLGTPEQAVVFEEARQHVPRETPKRVTERIPSTADPALPWLAFALGGMALSILGFIRIRVRKPRGTQSLR